MASSIMPILIDGSVLEGGGQILRNAVSLSALLNKAVSIQRIRSGRRPPGLKNQHRTGLELAATIASAQLSGAINGSDIIEFRPEHIIPGKYTADSVTAGSTSLLLQIAFPLFLFSPSTSPSTLTLLGGTNAAGAPQIDYAQNIFLPFVKRHFGVHDSVSIDIQRRGYFPKGGGRVLTTIPPPATHKLKSVSLLEGGVVKSIGGVAHSAWASNNVGNGMIRGARDILAEAGYDGSGVPVEIKCERNGREDADCQGSGIVLWVELAGGGMVGGSALGRKGATPVQVGREAATELIKGIEGGGAVDEWLQDQIIIFMALAEGRSELRCWKYGLSLHTRTAIWVAEQLTDAKFEIDESSSHTIIRCHGIGYTAPPVGSQQR